MSFAPDFDKAILDLAVELFGPDVTVYTVESVPVALEKGQADFVVVVPDGSATLADELALADALEISHPGVQPVLMLMARSELSDEGVQP